MDIRQEIKQTEKIRWEDPELLRFTNIVRGQGPICDTTGSDPGDFIDR
jgi:hypothetical protein